MSEEVRNPEVIDEKLTAEDYLKNLKALQDNTVSKDEYNRLVSENRKLADALANGLSYGEEAEEAEPVDVDALRKKLFDGPKYKNSLDFFKDFYALRDELIRQGKPDPTLGNNPEAFTRDNIEVFEDTANAVKECIEIADGDVEVFYSELKRRFKD